MFLDLSKDYAGYFTLHIYYVMERYLGSRVWESWRKTFVNYGEPNWSFLVKTKFFSKIREEQKSV